MWFSNLSCLSPWVCSSFFFTLGIFDENFQLALCDDEEGSSRFALFDHLGKDLGPGRSGKKQRLQMQLGKKQISKNDVCLEMIFSFCLVFSFNAQGYGLVSTKKWPPIQIQRCFPRQLVCRAKDLCHPWHISLYQTSVSGKINVWVSRLGKSSADTQHGTEVWTPKVFRSLVCIRTLLGKPFGNTCANGPGFSSHLKSPMKPRDDSTTRLVCSSERCRKICTSKKKKTRKHNSQWQQEGHQYKIVIYISFSFLVRTFTAKTQQSGCDFTPPQCNISDSHNFWHLERTQSVYPNVKLT